MYHNLLIHSSADGHLGYFHVLTTVNSTTMNTGGHVSISILVSLGRMPSSGIARSFGIFIPSFQRNLHSSCISLHSHQQFKRIPFSPAFTVCRLFDDDHSDQCEMIPRCGFDMHFSNNE